TSASAPTWVDPPKQVLFDENFENGPFRWDTQGSMDITASQASSGGMSGVVPPYQGAVSTWLGRTDGTGAVVDGHGGNNGTLLGGATVTENGRVGSAFEFDGVDDFIQIPDDPSLRPASLSLSAWFSFSSAPTGRDTIIAKTLR